MRYIHLTLLLILPLSLAPSVVLGAGAKPKAEETDDPTGGDRAHRQPAGNQAPAEPKVDDATEKADPDKADADTPPRRKITSRPTSMDIIPSSRAE